MRDEPWAIFWIIVVAIIAMTAYGCSDQANKNDTRKQNDVRELIEKGASPNAARCAVYGATGTNETLVCQTVTITEAMTKPVK